MSLFTFGKDGAGGFGFGCANASAPPRTSTLSTERHINRCLLQRDWDGVSLSEWRQRCALSMGARASTTAESPARTVRREEAAEKTGAARAPRRPERVVDD